MAKLSVKKVTQLRAFIRNWRKGDRTGAICEKHAILQWRSENQVKAVYETLSCALYGETWARVPSALDRPGNKGSGAVAKSKAADIEPLARLRAAGMTYAAIGERFGISRQAVHQRLTARALSA